MSWRGFRWVAATVAAAAAASLAVPLIRPGFVLARDSVAVPAQDLLPWMWGAGSAPPRSTPQDAVVAVLDEVFPGALVQRVLIVAGIVLLGLGVARLLHRRPALEQSAAALVAMWSAYVLERAAMGHWGLLVGVGALPWVLAAAEDLRAGRPGAPTRLLAWAAVGSLVPTAGVLQLAAAGAVLLWPPTPWRRAVSGVGLVLSVQLVWLVPGVAHPGAATAEGAAAFGMRATGAGPVLTALGTGGIWNAAAAAPSRAGALALIAPVVLVGLAVLGLRRLRCLGPVGPALGLLAALGLVWAVLTTVPGAEGLVLRIESVPGGGLLRDAQKWLAPWLVLLAVAAGLGVGWVRDRLQGREAAAPVIVLLVLAPVALLPDLALGAGVGLRPVRYPEAWQHVRSALERSDHPGDVASLPWSAVRAYDWNGGRPVLDPAPRYLPRTVVTDTRLLVADAGRTTVVGADDPRSAAVLAALGAPAPVAALLDEGIGWVLWQHGQPAAPGAAVARAELLEHGTEVVRGPDLSLIRLSGVARPSPTSPAGPVLAAWVIWGAAVGWVALVGLQRVMRMLPVPSGARFAKNRMTASARLRATDRS